MQMCIVAECYGNACIGEYLRGVLGGRVLHKPDYGRERILHNTARRFKQQCDRLLVLIDYEVSTDARTLVSKNFQLIQICEKVWVGPGLGKLAGVVAVVFDPTSRSSPGG